MGLFPKERNLAVAPDRVELKVRASDFRLRADEVHVRLDAFLQRHLTWRSRTSIQQLVRDGYVLVTQPAPDRAEVPPPAVEKRVSRVLRHGASVVVMIPEDQRLPEPVGDDEDLVVLYEDEEVLAVDKPADMPVHPSGRHMAGTLIQRVHARYQEGDEKLGLPLRLCHRLDLETSGVVLVGKGSEPHRHIMRQFERRRVEKEYLAIVHGPPDRDEGTVDLPLGPARGSKVHLKIAVRPDGQRSVTHWRVVERTRKHALLSVRPATGRQHQIRVHLEAIGHPLVGDKLYGVEEELFLRTVRDALTPEDHARLGLARHALHNHFLAWTSPADGERREVRSPLPEDLAAFLAREG